MTVQDVETAYNLLGDAFQKAKDAGQMPLWNRVRAALFDLGSELAVDAAPVQSKHKYYSGWPHYRCQYCALRGGH